MTFDQKINHMLTKGNVVQKLLGCCAIMDGYGNDHFTPAVVKLCRHKSAAVRAVAFETLSAIDGNKTYYREAARLAKREPDPTIRREADAALERLITHP
jgi:hypothetical protein